MPSPPSGFEGIVSWIVIVLGAVVTLYVYVAAIRCLLRPGEESPTHPKRLILTEDR